MIQEKMFLVIIITYVFFYFFYKNTSLNSDDSKINYEYVKKYIYDKYRNYDGAVFYDKRYPEEFIELIRERTFEGNIKTLLSLGVQYRVKNKKHRFCKDNLIYKLNDVMIDFLEKEGKWVEV